jgi:hypothetical protein
MDDRRQQDQPTTPKPVAQRRFEQLSRDSDAAYPMLSSGTGAHVGLDEEIFDEEILAALVNP